MAGKSLHPMLEFYGRLLRSVFMCHRGSSILFTVVMQTPRLSLLHTEELGTTLVSLEGVDHPRDEYTNHKELFNHRHAQLRNHIERAFRVLRNDFQS